MRLWYFFSGCQGRLAWESAGARLVVGGDAGCQPLAGKLGPLIAVYFGI